jgi:hypothetical protein
MNDIGLHPGKSGYSFRCSYFHRIRNGSYSKALTGYLHRISNTIGCINSPLCFQAYTGKAAKLLSKKILLA